MRQPIFDRGRIELPIGEYQAEVAAVMAGEIETIVYFRLTEPKSKGHPQAGLGGRVARAWFVTSHDNPVTQAEGEDALQDLLDVCNVLTPDAAIGRIVQIRLARVLNRSDPSRYRVEAVEFLPVVDRTIKPYEPRQ